MHNSVPVWKGAAMSFENAWLNYRRMPEISEKAYFSSVGVNSQGRITRTAVDELKRAAREILGMEMQETSGVQKQGICLKLNREASVGAEGYHIFEQDGTVPIESVGDRGLLYGSFALIRMLQTGKKISGTDLTEVPQNPIRILNHWDNMDGSIERGYSGNSFFFQDQKVLVNDRTRAYARLAASVGINASVINNVNVKGNATKLITETYRRELQEMAEIFADYGISLYLSLNFAAPMEIGGLNSADPLDENVREWWSRQMADVFTGIPNFGGFLVKADSEGRPGPFTYGRTHADGANMLADAAATYNGTIIWRCFVYNWTGGIGRPTGRDPDTTILCRWTVSSGRMLYCRSRTGRWISRSESRFLLFWAD